MTYIEIRIRPAEESRDALINKMSEMGSIGFVELDGEVSGYFEPDRTAEALCDELDRFRPVLKASGLDASFSLSHNVLPERDWNETWKKGFRPIDVGENLCIIPSWIQPETDRIPVIIDPGMVFGTGHHETTRTCLSLMERTARISSRKAFLDIGTGTGILAIGASRLGFEHVTAVDIDPLAVDAAERNAELNSCANITVLQGTIDDAGAGFDLIAANLLAEILIDIAPALSERLNPGGRAILSGMLVGQEQAVIDAMTSAGLSLQEQIIDDKWVSLMISR